MSTAADLKEYQTIIESSYRALLETYKSSIESGDPYTYNTDDFKGPFDNLSTIAFPKSDPSIISAGISSLEMYDDLLSLERAAIIADLDRADYYDNMLADIEVENTYLDNRSALFQKHLSLLEETKNK